MTIVKIIKDAGTAENLTWAIRVVLVGGKYGLHDQLVNTSEQPYVEFFDTRYPHTDLGQFVSRYYLDTFQEIKGGLCLDGGVPSWSVSGLVVKAAQKWLLDVVPDSLAEMAKAAEDKETLVRALEEAWVHLRQMAPGTHADTATRAVIDQFLAK